MSSELERRWDDAMEQAWTVFRQELADRIADLGAEEVEVVEVAADEDEPGLHESPPWCLVIAGEDELTVIAISNHFLRDGDRLTDAAQARLVELGFSAFDPDDETTNHGRVLPRSRSDEAAWMVATALREAYGVLHPAYLTGEDQPEEAGDPAAGPTADDAGGLPDLVRPASPDELRAALGEIGRRVVGDEVAWDDDGDLPLPAETTLVWLLVPDHLPRMMIHAVLVDDVVDRERALVEVVLLNRREIGLTFLLVDDAVVVRRELSLSVFFPDEVAAEIGRVRDQVDTWARELRDRLGGRLVRDHDRPVRRPLGAPAVPSRSDGDDPAYDEGVRVLRELEREERGSVSPGSMLRIFDADRGRLLRAVRESSARISTQGRRAREAEEAGRVRVARLVRREQAYERDLRARLRAALRRSVAATRGDAPAQLSLFAADEVEAP